MMWESKLVFTFALIMAHIGYCDASMLTAQKFQKTEQDLPFQSRVQNKADGYEPYAELSAYQMLQIQELNAYLADEIDRMEAEHQIYCAGAGQSTPECQPVTEEQMAQALQEQSQQNQQAQQTQEPQQTQTQQQPNEPSPSQQGTVTSPSPSQSEPLPTTPSPDGYCAKRHPHIPAGQTLPLGVPIDPSLPIYSLARDKGLVCSAFGGTRGRLKNGKMHYHEGVDLGCKMGGKEAREYFGTPVYASARGVVKTVQPATACKASGNMIKIEHADGFISYYMHLDKMFVKVGQTVEAGCQIGTMGHSGGNLVFKCPSMGIDITHLHYELRNPKHITTINAPNGTVTIKQTTIKENNKLRTVPPYIGNSLNPIELLKYKH